MTLSSERELLTQAAARELLERAGQIDADSTTVDTLRAAAREAGISEAAFEAALLEMRSNAATRPPPPRSWWKTIVAGTLVLAAAVFVIIPAKVAPHRADPLAGMVERNILVQCLPMTMAQEIAGVTLRSTGSDAFSVTVTSGSRILKVRATAEELDRVQAALKAAASSQKTCDNRPAGP